MGLRDDWLNEIRAEQSARKEWRETTREIIDRYKPPELDTKSFNIFWSNVETMRSSLYQSTPKPDVRRRFGDADELSREGSQIIERGISLALDDNFDTPVRDAINEYLRVGLGLLRVRYMPFFKVGVERVYLEPISDEEGAPLVLDGKTVEPDGIDELGRPYVDRDTPEKVSEDLRVEFVEWDRFGWDYNARKWEDVRWCYIEHRLTREELEEQFGSQADKIALTYRSPAKGESSDADLACVYEIFDKIKRRVVVTSEGYADKPLAVWDDPLQLEGFYPFARPLLSTLCSDKMEPIADYLFYKAQAEQVDTLTERIDAIVSAIKVRGVYDATFPEIADVLDMGDNQLAPVDNFTARTSGTGRLESVLAILPLKELGDVAQFLSDQREEQKAIIYEITGISDIVRGQGAASETATAQRIKGQFASMRINERSRLVGVWLRDTVRIMAEIMSEQYSRGTFELMLGRPVSDEVMALLRSDLLRFYRVDIETDSTVAVDMAEEQKNRIEALSAVMNFVQGFAQAAQAGAVPMELGKEMVLWAVRSFRNARELETLLEQVGPAQQQAPTPQGPQQQPMPGAPMASNVMPMMAGRM